MTRRSLVPALLLAAAIAALAAGCGGGGSGDSQEKATIQTNWEAFFNPATPTAKRISLLQNGARFAPLIRVVEANPLAQTLSAKVSNVDVTGSDSAKVKYTVYLGKQAVLKNTTGDAVLQNGIWKVGDASFCALAALQGATPKACQTSSG
jgi:hypothetical protein